MNILIVESEYIKKKLDKLVHQGTILRKSTYFQLRRDDLKANDINFSFVLSNLTNFSKKHELAKFADSLMQEYLYASIVHTLEQNIAGSRKGKLASKNNFQTLKADIQKWIRLMNTLLGVSKNRIKKSKHFHIKHSVRGFGLLNVFTNDKVQAKRSARKLVNKQALKPLEKVTRLYKPDLAKKRKATYINNIKNTTPYQRKVQWMAHHLLYEWPTIPQRSTKGSAGYDLKADRYTIIPSLQKNPEAQPVNVHTGLKVYFPNNEMLGIFNRSSNPIKRHLFLSNGVGVDDADYYSNPSNDGELLISLINTGSQDYVIHRGDRIAQGVFLPCFKADIDMPVKSQRTGGQGSTGK